MRVCKFSHNSHDKNTIHTPSKILLQSPSFQVIYPSRLIHPPTHLRLKRLKTRHRPPQQILLCRNGRILGTPGPLEPLGTLDHLVAVRLDKVGNRVALLGELGAVGQVVVCGRLDDAVEVGFEDVVAPVGGVRKGVQGRRGEKGNRLTIASKNLQHSQLPSPEPAWQQLHKQHQHPRSLLHNRQYSLNVPGLAGSSTSNPPTSS
jgi:hypothetical protein